jgi:hypothetical protein
MRGCPASFPQRMVVWWRRAFSVPLCLKRSGWCWFLRRKRDTCRKIKMRLPWNLGISYHGCAFLACNNSKIPLVPFVAIPRKAYQSLLVPLVPFVAIPRKAIPSKPSSPFLCLLCLLWLFPAKPKISFCRQFRLTRTRDANGLRVQSIHSHKKHKMHKTKPLFTCTD